MSVDDRKRRAELAPIPIEAGVHIIKQLSWSNHTKTVMKRARQRNNNSHLRRLKRFDMGHDILKKLYSCTIESILTSCINAWFCNCSASDLKARQMIVHMAAYITGAKLPAIPVLYTRRCQRKALKTVNDSSHPSHRLFSLLLHGKQGQV